MPWEADAPSLRLRPGGPDLAAAAGRATPTCAVDQQDGVDGLDAGAVPRAARPPRRDRALGTGSLTWVEGWPEQVVAFAVTPADGGERTLVLTNLGEHPVALPEGAQPLLSSGPLGPDGTVPTDTTVWARW